MPEDGTGIRLRARRDRTEIGGGVGGMLACAALECLCPPVPGEQALWAGHQLSRMSDGNTGGTGPISHSFTRSRQATVRSRVIDSAKLEGTTAAKVHGTLALSVLIGRQVSRNACHSTEYEVPIAIPDRDEASR
jgi:hypothetical protein